MAAPTNKEINTSTPSFSKREDPWNDTNFADTVAAFRLDQDQQAKLRELQTLLSDIDHWKNDPFEVARYVMDFYKWPPPKIAKLFRKMVAWRIEHGMDTFCEIYNGGKGPPVEFQYFPLCLMRDLDYDGDPIYVFRTGAFDAWGMYQRVGGPAIVEFNKFLGELLGTRNPPGIPNQWKWQTEYYEGMTGGRKFSQFTCIIDMKGLSSRHLHPSLFGMLNEIARNGQDYYAGFPKRIIILRAPRLFQIGWSVAKHFFDAHLQALITFTTASDYLQVCDQYMDRRSLPSVICPTEGKGRPMPGYFECIHMEGGTIPDKIPDWTASISSGTDLAWPSSQASVRSKSAVTATKSISLLKGHLDLSNQLVILE